MRCVVSLMVALAAAMPTAAERPNVVVLFVDDLGYRDIGVYGGPVETLALDALAANGVRFTDFHSGSGVCSPSRAVVMTGRKGAFSRAQPLFWFSPDAGAAVRDAKYSLVAYPGYQLPKDRDGMQHLFEQVKAVLEETNDPALTHGDLWTQMFNGFKTGATKGLPYDVSLAVSPRRALGTGRACDWYGSPNPANCLKVSGSSQSSASSLGKWFGMSS